jgi:hypothetical protein
MNVMTALYWAKRWMYRNGRPGLLARAMNRASAVQFSAGLLSPKRAVTVEVPGRRTGRVISFPVVVAEYAGERDLVSMLGNNANWVRNVRAAGGGSCCVAVAARRCTSWRSKRLPGRLSCAGTSRSRREPGPTCRWTAKPH